MSLHQNARTEPNRLDNGYREQHLTHIVSVAALVLLVVLTFLHQLDVITLTGSWWTVIVALPAVAMLYSAYHTTMYERRFTVAAGSYLIGGVVVGGIALLAAISQMDLLLPFLLIVLASLLAFAWIHPGRARE